MSSSETKEPFDIYKQSGSSRWYVRFSIKGQGQQRIALGTADEAEAKQLARTIYYEHTFETSGSSDNTFRAFF